MGVFELVPFSGWSNYRNPILTHAHIHGTPKLTGAKPTLKKSHATVIALWSRTTNRSREYDGNQRRSVYFHRTASSGWDRTCWSICFNLWNRCACLSDTTDSKVKYNKIKGKQMQVHANPKCCTAEFRRGSGRSPVLSLDAINADRQVLRACSENW